jgi:hypothetical protein
MPEGLEVISDKDFRDMIWFLLNPPGDKRPWTPALWRELIGEELKKNAAVGAPGPAGSAASPTEQSSTRSAGASIDMESVALWNPDWNVDAPEFEGTPRKLGEYAGRKNVLETHPFSREKAASIERTVRLPKSSRVGLQFHAAAHERGDWELLVHGNNALLYRHTISTDGERWKRCEVDLTPFAGQTLTLRLENAANDWAWEFGYWSDIELVVTQQTAGAK